MSGTEDDLIARLNALKPSSVAPVPLASVDVQVSRPKVSLEDGLAERLKALRSGKAPTRVQAAVPVRRPGEAELRARVVDEVGLERGEGLGDWGQGGGENRGESLEDLLAELGSGEEWKLDPDDTKHIDGLLREAREALPPSGQDEVVREHEDVLAIEDDQKDPEEGEEDEEKRDERDAKEYVEKVLAEIDLEAKHGVDDERDPPDEGHEQGQKDDLFSGLVLPSTPSDLPRPKEEAESAQDDDLASRFSKLGMDLPSTPSSKPTSKKTTAAKPKSKLPKYTDEDVESWCCICNEDGEVKCLGCDEDIFCRNCWNEGHGTGPGQERGHRAVQFVRRGSGADVPTA